MTTPFVERGFNFPDERRDRHAVRVKLGEIVRIVYFHFPIVPLRLPSRLGSKNWPALKIGGLPSLRFDSLRF